MRREVTIGAIQLPIWSEGKTDRQRWKHNLKNIEEYLLACADKKVHLAAMSEVCNVTDVKNWKPFLSDFTQAPETKIASGIARDSGMHVVLPIYAYQGENLRNMAVLIGRDGEIIGHYDKVHLTKSERYQSGVVPGDHFPVFDLEFGTVGIMICHDMSFPEAGRCLGLAGAELVLWPSWWDGWGQDISNAVIKSRAIDNGYYLVQLSFGQNPENARWLTSVMSRTCVINPEGMILAASQRFPGIACATIDLDLKRRAPHFTRCSNDEVFREEMLSDRVPVAYGPICDESLVPKVAPEEIAFGFPVKSLSE